MVNNKLKAKIIEHFGSQSDFAEFLKYDESNVSRVVRGRRQLSKEDRIKWAKALRCRPEEILGVSQ